MLDKAQKELLRHGVADLRPKLLEAGLYFFRRLFEFDPSLRAVFDRGPIEEQARKLMQLIDVAVQSIDDWDVLLPSLDELGRDHASYGVRPDHYEVVGSSLMATLRTFLTDSWSLEMEDAWLDFYAEISSRMEAAGQNDRPAF